MGFWSSSFGTPTITGSRPRQTVVGISGTSFTINGLATNPGKPAAGTLMNSRMIQGIYDDEGGTTAYLNYPDTGVWNADRQVTELCANLWAYRTYGLQMITVGLQGGSPAGISNGTNVTTAFNADGSLKTASWMRRLDQLLRAADSVGMVVMVSLYYQGQVTRLNSPDGVTATNAGIDAVVDWLIAGGYSNVLLEVANEYNINTNFPTNLQPASIHLAVKRAQDRAIAAKYTLYVGASPLNSTSQPTDALIAQADYVTNHGNGRSAAQITSDITYVQGRPGGTTKPIIVNEDPQSLANLDAAVAATPPVGWGYYDQGTNDYLTGYQSPPTNWAPRGTAAKAAFFDKVATKT